MGQNFEILFFVGFGIVPIILFGYVNLCGNFWGMSVLAGILGISFQNIPFCKIFCDAFMKQM